MQMPTTEQDLKEQQERLRAAGAKSTQLAGVGSSFIANVKEELRKRAQDKGVSQLGQQASATRKEFAEAPTRIREEYKGIDPYKKMSAVAERTGSILAELNEIADLKSQRQASITDILGGMKGGIEAEAQQAAQQFGMEQTLYQNMFGQYQTELENTWKQKQFDQANEQMAITQSYNNAMIAIQEGNLELANQQFEEAKRHELIAEQLNQEKLALEQELSYAQMASQEKQTYAGITSAEKIAQMPARSAGGGEAGIPDWLGALLMGGGGQTPQVYEGTPRPFTPGMVMLDQKTGELWEPETNFEYANMVQRGYKEYIGGLP